DVGMASRGAIWLDQDAAGYGWSRVDPLTVMTHEMGHLLGFEHSEGGDVMAPMLFVAAAPLPTATPLAQDRADLLAVVMNEDGNGLGFASLAMILDGSLMTRMLADGGSRGPAGFLAATTGQGTPPVDSAPALGTGPAWLLFYRGAPVGDLPGISNINSTDAGAVFSDPVEWEPSLCGNLDARQ